MVKSMKNISIAARALVIGLVAALVLVGTAMGDEVIFQDDFEKDSSQWTLSGTGGGVQKISSAQAHTGKSSLLLELTDGNTGDGQRTASKEFPSGTKGHLTVWYYYIAGKTHQEALTVTDSSNNAVNFIISSKDGGLGYPTTANIVNTNNELKTNWYKFELYVNDDGTKAYINGVNVQSPKLSDIKRIQLTNGWRVSGTESYWDDILLVKPSINPSLALTKSLSPSTITEGDSTTVTIRVENTGGDAKSVKIADTIPQGFTIISGSASQEYATLKATESRTFQYTIKATGNSTSSTISAAKDAGIWSNSRWHRDNFGAGASEKVSLLHYFYGFEGKYKINQYEIHKSCSSSDAAKRNRRK